MCFPLNLKLLTKVIGIFEGIQGMFVLAIVTITRFRKAGSF